MSGQDTRMGLSALARAERVAFAGGHVCWRRFGDGPPLVLLHGGHGSWLHWTRNIPALAQRCTVWVPDLPGYGDSDPPGGTSLDDLLGATLQTLDQIVPRGMRLDLAGFSFGGLVAARLAAMRGNVQQLALFGPAGHGGARRPRGELKDWRGLEHPSQAWDDCMRHNLMVHMLHEPGSVDEAAIRIHGTACRSARFHSKSLSRAGGLVEALAARAGRLILVWGEHDVTAVPSVAARQLAEGRADCEVHILPGAGHWVQYEAADAVNRLLLDAFEHIFSADRP